MRHSAVVTVAENEDERVAGKEDETGGGTASVSGGTTRPAAAGWLGEVVCGKAMLLEASVVRGESR